MKMPSAVIREEILKSGAISFARFMELALYCPETGYYEAKKDTVGARGDFITSVSVGRLFGELLAFQFAEWLQAMPCAECGVRMVEAGAHDGKLAADILHWLQTHREQLFSKVEYAIVEPSEERRRWQKETLAKWADKLLWVSHLSDLADPRCNIIFSNELLDALPVHRYGWDAKQNKWFEWGVLLEGEKFAWTRLGNAPSAICNPQLESVLPDGYIIEVSPAAENWWRAAAHVLKRGKLVTIDYGHAGDGRFSPGFRNSLWTSGDTRGP